MELEIHPISLSSICAGCLCSNRELTQLWDNESKKLFCEFLESFENINQPISLCWECTALVHKVILFKRQVKTAQECLIRYTFNNSIISPLSNLKVSKIETLDTVDSETPNSKVTYSTATLSRNKLNSRTSNNIDSETETDLTVSGDIEGYYVDETLDYEEYGDDYQDSKTFLKSDSNCKIKTQNESTRTQRKTTAEDFNESDDEPLNRKKKKEHKHKGRREKKVDDTKVDGRKQPGPKREKPPGVVNNSRVSRKLQQLNVPSGHLEMVVLSWEEVEEERQKALASVKFTRHEYRCYDCILGFNHRFKLENHMKKHDPAGGGVACEVCRVRCRDAHALSAHRRRHRVRWRCCRCGGAWSRAGVAADHGARAHAAPPPAHVCALCGHRATTLGKLRNHIKSHAERQKCELCGKTFRDRTALNVHLFIHKGEKEYACPSCGKRFLFKKAMEVHMVTHDAPAHLYCHECDMNFKNRMSYYQHMKYNLKHIDPAKLKYACALCDKKFVKATRLEEHNLAVHLKATPIRCSVSGCHFACSSRPVLRTHTRMVHRNARALRNHVCDTCGKAYTTKKTLEGHMRTHTGERPFHCPHCPSTFGYEAALYNHNKLVHLKAKTGRGRGPPVPPALGPLAVPPDPPAWSTVNITENTVKIT